MLSLEEAYEAAFDSGVCVPHPRAQRIIRITGTQRVWFLQNTITADIEAVEPGRWVESCLLDEKGRVFAHFLVGIGEEAIVIADDPAYGSRLADWFASRRFRTKVEIEAIARPFATVFGAPVAEVADGTFTDEFVFGRAFGDVGGADMHRDPRDDVPQGPPELHEILRIEAGRGLFGVDFDERTLPQEAGLSHTLSVEKGCYVGQETVARIHFRGHINKVVRTLSFDGAIPPVGSEIRYEDSVVGRVTSVATSPRKGPIGLGMVRVEPPGGAEVELAEATATLGPLAEGTKVKPG